MKRARNKNSKKRFLEEISERQIDIPLTPEDFKRDSESDSLSYVDSDLSVEKEDTKIEVPFATDDYSDSPVSNIHSGLDSFADEQIPFATDESVIDDFDPEARDLYEADKEPENEAEDMKRTRKGKNSKKKKKGGTKSPAPILIIILSIIILLFILLMGLGKFESCGAGCQLTNRISEDDSIYDYMTQVDSSKIEDLGTINILLLGVDKDGLRSDSIMLVNYDVNTHKINLISIPRDTRIYVEDRATYRKITEVHGMHDKNNQMYGAAAVAKSVIELTGMPINYYVEFSFSSVDEIMDILGPVTFDVPDLEGKGRGMNYDDPYQDLHIHLKPGVQQLSGNQIQQFLRYRKSNYGTVDGSDINRVKRQQELLAAIMDQKLNVSLVGKLPDIFNKVNDSLKTTFTTSDIMYFSAYLLTNIDNISSENMESFVLPGDTSTIDGKSYFICDLEETAELITEKFGYEVDEDDLSNVITLTGEKSSGRIKTPSKPSDSSKNTSSDNDSSSKKSDSDDQKDDDKKQDDSKKDDDQKDDSKKDDSKKDDSETSSSNKKDSSDKNKNDSDKSEESDDKDSENKNNKDTNKTDNSSSKDSKTDENKDSDSKESDTNKDSSKASPSDSSNSENKQPSNSNQQNDEPIALD